MPALLLSCQAPSSGICSLALGQTLTPLAHCGLFNHVLEVQGRKERQSKDIRALVSKSKVWGKSQHADVSWKPGCHFIDRKAEAA